MEKKVILIAGGTGLIGQRFISLYQDKYEIRILSQRLAGKVDGIFYYKWDVSKSYIDETALEGVDTLINLAGAGIADKRWASARKKEIIESRVNSNELLQNTLARYPKVKCIINASAIGIYGDDLSIKDESSKFSKTDFLSETCIHWEDSAALLKPFAHRQVILRIGIVLSLDGGALPQMNATSKFGFLAKIGSGNQFMSWIHIDDLVSMIDFTISNNQVEGIINGVSPNPINHSGFISVLKKVQSRVFIIFPAFAFMIKVILGEMSAVVLSSTNVIPKKAMEFGFKFRYTLLEDALRNLIK